MLYLCFGSIILFQKWLKWRTCNSINRPSILIDCWHLSVLFKVNMYSVDVYFLFFPLQLVYSNWEGMIFSLLLSRLLASFLQILLSLENWKTAITFNLKNSTKPWTSRSALVLKKNVPTFFFPLTKYHACWGWKDLSSSFLWWWQAWYFTEATKAIASVTPGHCLGALKMIQYKFAISS